MRPRATTRKLDARRAGFKCLGQDTENAFINRNAVNCSRLNRLATPACSLQPPIESPQALVEAE
jgi:hypothetical protein